MLNHEGNAGAKVAEAAGWINRQGDDTRAAFTDSKELILEKKNLEAVSPDSYANEPTSGNNSEFKYSSPNNSGHMSMAKNGNANDEVGTGSNAGLASIYGINPVNVLTSDAPESSDEKNDQDEDGAADKAVASRLTFNDRAREIQGDSVLTQHQEATDRIVSNWTPQYVAAKREHQELVGRINDTRELWPGYRQEQITLISPSSNGSATPSWATSCGCRWSTTPRPTTAGAVRRPTWERRSAQVRSKIEDMNTFILFKRTSPSSRR